MEYNLKSILTKEELDIVKEIISKNDRRLTAGMGIGIDSIAIRVQDATEEMKEEMENNKLIHNATKAIKYINVHNGLLRYRKQRFEFPAAEVKYVFFDENGIPVAQICQDPETEEVKTETLTTKIFELKNIEGYDGFYQETIKLKREFSNNSR